MTTKHDPSQHEPSQPCRHGAPPSLCDASLAPAGQDLTFHYAAEYVDRGYAVIPLIGKRPAIAWSAYQTRRPTLAEIRDWFAGARGDGRNIGIVTGPISDLVVVDCDSPEAVAWWRERFSETPLVVTTGRGGAHLYYRLDDGDAVRNRTRVLGRNIDIRGQGGYAVAPPSVHPATGVPYRWQPWDHYQSDAIPVFDPAWIAEKPSRPTGNAQPSTIHNGPAYIAHIKAISGQGGHNATFRAACALRDAGMTPAQALAALLEWNETNAVPEWDVKELLHKVEDAFRS